MIAVERGKRPLFHHGSCGSGRLPVLCEGRGDAAQSTFGVDKGLQLVALRMQARGLIVLVEGDLQRADPNDVVEDDTQLRLSSSTGS